jgi:hypothetical protein
MPESVATLVQVHALASPSAWLVSAASPLSGGWLESIGWVASGIGPASCVGCEESSLEQALRTKPERAKRRGSVFISPLHCSVRTERLLALFASGAAFLPYGECADLSQPCEGVQPLQPGVERIAPKL